MTTSKDIALHLFAYTDQFNKEMDKVSAKLKKTGDSFTNFGRGAAIRFAALSAGIIGLTKTFAGLEKGLANTLTLLDAPQVAQFGDTIKTQVNTAVASMGFTIGEANKAMFDTVSALGASSKSMQVYAEAQRLAVGGGADLRVTTDGLTSIVNAYGRETTNATEVAVAFFDSQKYGKTTVAELAASVGKAAPIAKQLGVSYQELLATMSQLTLGGLSTELATTALRATMVALLKPTAGAAKVLRKLGVPVGTTEVKAAGFTNTLKALNKAAEENPDLLGEMIPNIRALVGVGALGTEQLENLDMIIQSIGDETEKSADGMDVLTSAVDRQQETVDFAFKKMTGSFTIAAAAIGEALAPAIIKLSGLIEGFSNFITNLSPTTKSWIAGILLTVTALTGLAAVVGLVGGAILKLSAIIIDLKIPLLASVGWIALIVVGLTALSVAIKTNFLGLGTFFKTIIAGISTIAKLVSSAIDKITFSWKSLEDKSNTVKGALKENVKAMQQTQQELDNLKNKTLTTNDDLEKHEATIMGVTAELGRLMKEQKKLKKQTIEIEVKRLEQIPGVTPEAAQRIAEGNVEEIIDPTEDPEFLRRQAVDEQLAVQQAKTDTEKVAAKVKLQDTLAEIEKKGQEKARKFEEAQVKRRMLFLAANNTAELKAREQTLTDLAAMTQSGNETLASIGKAAAIYQASIATYTGAIAAYASLAGIPIVGPALGIIAAAAISAYGAERIANIQGAQLAVGSPGLEEDMIAQFSKNEIVVPETFAEGIRGGDLALVGAGEGSTGGGAQIINNFDFTDAVLGSPSSDFISAIEDSIFERAKLSIGGID